MKTTYLKSSRVHIVPEGVFDYSIRLSFSFLEKVRELARELSSDPNRAVELFSQRHFPISMLGLRGLLALLRKVEGRDDVSVACRLELDLMVESDGFVWANLTDAHGNEYELRFDTSVVSWTCPASSFDVGPFAAFEGMSFGSLEDAVTHVTRQVD